ncbi:MAG: helix-turn-helix domain-containing protein [Candidatus Binataceae bacterium]
MRASALQRAFGRRVRELRRARGWTQEELGHRTRRHWTYIGGIERGERNPTLIVIGDLAAGLGVSLGQLFASVKATSR